MKSSFVVFRVGWSCVCRVWKEEDFMMRFPCFAFGSDRQEEVFVDMLDVLCLFTLCVRGGFILSSCCSSVFPDATVKAQWPGELYLNFQPFPKATTWPDFPHFLSL